MNRWLLVACVLGGVIQMGCSSGSKPAADGQNAAGVAAAASPAQPVHVAADAPPDQVISVFLNALRVGDKATTANLLTSKAREETAKHDLVVDPPAAPNAQYQVHQPEFLAENPNGAHVTSTWTETFDDGTNTYEIVWVLRKQTEGWRIAGMALELSPGQGPAFLNYEDPADMMRKAQEAMAAQQPPAAEVAQTPAPPLQATPAPGNGAQFTAEPSNGSFQPIPASRASPAIER